MNVKTIKLELGHLLVRECCYAYDRHSPLLVDHWHPIQKLELGHLLFRECCHVYDRHRPLSVDHYHPIQEVMAPAHAVTPNEGKTV
jgi:hypothetical protein